MQKLNHNVNNTDNDIEISYISVSDIKNKVIPDYDIDFWTVYSSLKTLLKFPNTEEGKKRYSSWLFSKGYSYNNKTVEAIKNICIANNIDWNKVRSKQITIKNTWDKSYDEKRNIGNLLHAHIDNVAFKERSNLSTLLTIKNSQGLLTYNLWEIPDGTYTELTIYDNINFIIGRVDWMKIKTLPSGERMVDIDDHKTHKEVKLNSKYKLLSPVNHLPHCEYYINAIQLNLYAFIMLSWGFKINSLKFTNYLILNKSDVSKNIPTEYKVPNLQTEILLILKKHIKKC